jgi:hypothetical protein
MRPTCKVCSSPDTAAVVDRLLQQGVFLRDIAEQVGLSKSSIHRHSLKCFVRHAAAKLKTGRYNPTADRVLTRFVDVPTYRVSRDPLAASTAGSNIPATELRPRDVVLKIPYPNLSDVGVLLSPTERDAHEKTLLADVARAVAALAEPS